MSSRHTLHAWKLVMLLGPKYRHTRRLLDFFASVSSPRCRRHTIVATSSSSHHRRHTIAATPSPSHHRCHVVVVTPSSPHHRRHTIVAIVVATPSPPRHHRHTIAATSSSPHHRCPSSSPRRHYLVPESHSYCVPAPPTKSSCQLRSLHFIP